MLELVSRVRPGTNSTRPSTPAASVVIATEITAATATGRCMSVCNV